MSNELKLRQANNEVSGCGYLKDFDLKYESSANGGVVIRGEVTLATDVQRSYKLRVYCPKTTSLGNESKAFPYFDKLITEGKEVNSYQNILQKAQFEGLTKEQALAMSKKIFIKGSISPWERMTETDDVITSNDIRLSFIGDAKEENFAPSLKFKCEIFIQNLKAEKDESGEMTGRGILEGLLPLYNNDVSRFTAIIPAEYKESVFNAYDVGKTVEIYGDYEINITKKESKEAQPLMAFGIAPEQRESVDFRREMVVYGGSQPYSFQNERAYNKEDIEQARCEKIELLKENREEYKNREKQETSATTIIPSSTPKKGVFNFS